MNNNKERIIHEAQKLFSLNGYLNTGVNDIISAAGTSKGGFYNHFASKEELFLDVLKTSQQIWREKVLVPVTPEKSPTEKIVQILHNYRDDYLRDAENFPGGCIFITFSVELDDTNPHLVKEVYKGFEGFKRVLVIFLEEGKTLGEFPPHLDSKKVADCLFTGMLGASVLYGVNKSTGTLNRSIGSLIDYILLLGGNNGEVFMNFDQ
jgi:TetR/AcrR family transcriptional repressor of nem operon